MDLLLSNALEFQVLDSKTKRWVVVMGVCCFTVVHFALRWALFVDELTFLTISAVAWGCLVPLLAHFGLIILMWSDIPLVQFVETMCVSAVLIKLTVPELSPVLAHLRLVVDSEVLDIPEHLLS